MAAADPTRESHSRRFIALLEQVGAQVLRLRRKRSGDARPSPHRPSTALNLGDLAVAQLVHDLRNQLTLMVGYVDNVAEVVVTGEADHEIAELRECAERALRLTRELLVADRPPSATRRPLNLNQLVASAAELFAPMMGDRIVLRLRLSPITIPVLAERIEIERILLNLALNACDAIVGDGVLTITTGVVGNQSDARIESTLPGRYARLTVSDTGCGMLPDVKPRIFEPFFTTKEMGTGLGLSSVAFTVRELGGNGIRGQPARPRHIHHRHTASRQGAQRSLIGH